MKNEDGELTAGRHISFWIDTIEPDKAWPLKEDLVTDVVIVGGGIAGLTTAYCLTRAGKKVVVVEDGLIGSGETGHTTAHLVTALDDRYYELEKYFGIPKTHVLAMSHAAAIDFVERVVKRESIDCGFERLNGYLFLHPTDHPDSLDREFDAARRAGINVIESDVALPGLGKSLCFPGQAQFHPLKYLKGLCAAIEKRGGKIFTDTHADKIDNHGITTSKGYHVQAKHVVIATNSPVNNKYSMHLKQYAYRTYVIGALVKKDSVARALWWDTGNFKDNADVPPYHYVRVAPYNDEFDLLISGGEDHPIADTSKKHVPEENRYGLLEEWTRKYFPIEDVIYRWSGQVMEPMDGIAFIGRNPADHDNIYIITGDSGNGMTHCTIGALLITDLITGRENSWEELYRPSRFTVRASKPFFKEVLGSLFSSFKHDDDAEEKNASFSTLEKGEARVFEREKQKWAAYCDNEGELHVVSATCTHLGCTVKWNNDEKSWDCPCHGSRFSCEGKVMNGPANTDLKKYQENKVLEKKYK